MPNVVHLNRYFHFTELMRDHDIKCEVRRYRSEFDGTFQSLFVMEPAHDAADKLFIFFHGMDGDCGDAVVLRDLVKNQNAVVVGVGGRGPSWLSDGFVADAIHTVRSFADEFDDYYLIGVSMGGTQVLSLAGLLPDDLKETLRGVIALIPGVSLDAMVLRSSHERVRNTVSASGSHFAGKNPIDLVDAYKEGLPFLIFYNQDDTLLLSDELESYIELLRKRGHAVSTFVAPGTHDFTYSNFDYSTFLRSLGSNSSVHGAPLLD